MTIRQHNILRIRPRILIFIPFAIPTLIQIGIVTMFKKNINVWFPQFADFKSFDKIFQYIYESAAYSWYKAFFIIDMIWAAIGLITLYVLIQSFKENVANTHPTSDRHYQIGAKLFMAVAVLAYGFDAYENIMYLLGIGSKLPVVVGLKQLFYIVALLIVISMIFKKHVYKRIEIIIQFIISSSISITILIIIAILLSKMGQGASIIIELLKSKGNLLLSFMLITFLAQILSHFPNYFLEYVMPELRKRNWIMHDKWRFLGFGTIYYRYATPRTNLRENKMRVWHHALGMVTFLAFVYIFLHVANSQQLLSNNALAITIVLFIAAQYWYNRFYKRSNISREKVVKILWILVIISIILLAFGGWSITGVFCTVLGVTSLLFAYSIFRVYRIRLEIGSLAYISGMRVIGSILLIVLFVLNVQPNWSIVINPLNILLLYLIIYYSILALYVKHILYYTDTEQEPEVDKKYRFYKYLLPLAAFFLLVFLFNGHRINNNLHVLSQAHHHKDSTLTITQYTAQLPLKDLEGDYLQKHYYLGAYGGGIRANSWTLLVLHELQKRSNGNFLHATVGISGVSGGMIGLGNYTALFDRVSETDIIASTIDSIALNNFLSIDLLMALGRDLVLEYVPGTNARDRAHKAMSIYAQFTQASDGLEDKSFQNFWYKIYKEQKARGNHFPAVFVNSTSTTGQQGIGASVVSTMDLVPGSKSILDGTKNGKQLSYFSTLSSSNRFPVLSPAARIKGVGHFVDGGYFENSGMLTLYHLYKTMRSQSQDHVLEPHFINILNGKEEYLKWWIRFIEKRIPCISENLDENISGEWSAILNTVVSIDKVPNYVKNEINKYHFLTEIPLPYPITYDEVIMAIGGKSECPDLLLKEINMHNEQLTAALGERSTGIVIPSLARLQSMEVLEYQKSMLSSMEIDTILNSLVKRDAILNLEHNH